MELHTRSACPDSPNCVSTFATDSRHQILPYEYRGSLESIQAKLEKILLSMGAVSQKKQALQWHYVFTSKIFRFKDDVFFEFIPNESKIHFRSSSRKGYSDFGVNRRRMESIRQSLQD